MLAGLEALRFTLTLSGAFLVGVLGLLGLSTQHAQLIEGRRRLARLAAGHRFLCPGCLQFGPVRYACGGCMGELEPIVIHARGFYLNDCPHCHMRVFPRWYARKGCVPAAYCAACEGAFNLRVHQRQVRVLGVLDAKDLDRLRMVPDAPALTGSGMGYFYGDDTACLTYVVNAGDPREEGGELPRTHAVRDLEAVWMDRVLEEPLALGQALDRFIRRAGLTESERRALRVCVRPETLPAAARNLLESRFGTIEYGVTAGQFLPYAIPYQGELQVRSPFLEQNC
jgi:hypothetical protein